MESGERALFQWEKRQTSRDLSCHNKGCSHHLAPDRIVDQPVETAEAVLSVVAAAKTTKEEEKQEYLS